MEVQKQVITMLKNKLDTEGLFDLTKKMPFPRFPKHICIVTSSSTAAFQDILSSLKRRCPFANISISEAVVQGDSASKTIISALKRIQKFKKNIDDIINDIRHSTKVSDFKTDIRPAISKPCAEFVPEFINPVLNFTVLFLELKLPPEFEISPLLVFE